MFEERTVGTDDSPEHLSRFSYSNHLGSASLELDDTAAIISYEEYHPYGTTSYQAMNASINAVAKRYRYTGKERDEESGLYYHGARYYACWLARWTAVDPAEGKYAGMSPYNYCFNNPVMHNDPSGAEPPGGGDWVKKKGGMVAADNARRAPYTHTNNTSFSATKKDVPLTKVGASAKDNVGVGATPPGIRTPGQQQIVQDAKEKAAAHERYMNEEVLALDMYGMPHDGKRRDVEWQVQQIATEHYNAVGDKMVNSFVGSQAYAASGGDERYLNLFSVFDAWAMYKSGYTNAAAGNVISAKPAIEPATTPATEAPVTEPAPPPASAGTMERTADGTYAIRLTEQQTAKVNPRVVTNRDLILFGNASGPTPLRVGKDVTHGENGIVPSQAGVQFPHGKSSFRGPVEELSLKGHYHILPEGTELPENIDYKADGKDIYENSNMPIGHYTIFNTTDMHIDDLDAKIKEMFLNTLYGGNKKK